MNSYKLWIPSPRYGILKKPMLFGFWISPISAQENSKGGSLLLLQWSIYRLFQFSFNCEKCHSWIFYLTKQYIWCMSLGDFFFTLIIIKTAASYEILTSISYFAFSVGRRELIYLLLWPRLWLKAKHTIRHSPFLSAENMEKKIKI